MFWTRSQALLYRDGVNPGVDCQVPRKRPFQIDKSQHYCYVLEFMLSSRFLIGTKLAEDLF